MKYVGIPASVDPNTASTFDAKDKYSTGFACRLKSLYSESAHTNEAACRTALAAKEAEWQR